MAGLPEPESDPGELARLRERVAELEGLVALHRQREADAVRAQRQLQQVIDALPKNIFWKDTSLVYIG